MLENEDVGTALFCLELANVIGPIPVAVSAVVTSSDGTATSGA